MASEHALEHAAKRLLEGDPADRAFDVPTYEALLALTREAVARLGWGTMTYACDTCSFEWEIWLALGVEGPPALREASLYIAAPVMLGSCPAWPDMTTCPGGMKHVRWNDDREFPPTLIPDDAPRFVLPSSLSGGGEGASLVIPTPALVRARRALNEPSGGEGGDV